MKNYSVACQTTSIVADSLDMLLTRCFQHSGEVKTWSMDDEISQSWRPSKAHRWQPPLILSFLNKFFSHRTTVGWFTVDLCCVSLFSPAESSAFPHGLPLSTMPPISLFCLHSSCFSLPLMPYKNHPHHPMTQKAAGVIAGQEITRQAEQTEQKHITAFLVPQRIEQSGVSPSSLLYPNADFKNICECIGSS